jgi:hypothetical protein
MILTDSSLVKDYGCLDGSLPSYIPEFAMVAQFPLVGQAVVMTYNVPAIDATNLPPLVRYHELFFYGFSAFMPFLETNKMSVRQIIDRETLGRIWYSGVSLSLHFYFYFYYLILS